jgi:hypothetical protein
MSTAGGSGVRAGSRALEASVGDGDLDDLLPLAVSGQPSTSKETQQLKDVRFQYVDEEFKGKLLKAMAEAEETFTKRGEPSKDERAPYKTVQKNGKMFVCLPKRPKSGGEFHSHLCLLLKIFGGEQKVTYIETSIDGSFTAPDMGDVGRKASEAMLEALKGDLALSQSKEDTWTAKARNIVLHHAAKAALSSKLDPAEKEAVKRLLGENDHNQLDIGRWYLRIGANSSFKDYDHTYCELVRLIAASRGKDVVDNITRLPISSMDIRRTKFKRREKIEIINRRKVVKIVYEPPPRPWQSAWVTGVEQKHYALVLGESWVQIEKVFTVFDQIKSTGRKHRELRNALGFTDELLKQAKRISGLGRTMFSIRHLVIESFLPYAGVKPPKFADNRSLMKLAIDAKIWEAMTLDQAVLWHPVHTLSEYPAALKTATDLTNDEAEFRHVEDNPDSPLPDLGVANLIRWWRTTFSQFANTDGEAIIAKCREMKASELRKTASFKEKKEEVPADK